MLRCYHAFKKLLVCYIPLDNSASARRSVWRERACNQSKCDLFYSVPFAFDGCESSNLAVPCALCYLSQRLGKRKGLASGAMVLYSLHVFDRSGRCLFDREWNGPRRDDGSGEHPRLVFGMLHSLGEVSNKLAPRGRAPDGHITVRTDSYALHAFEALSGYRFVLLADAEFKGDPRAVLFHVYAQLWVECVVKSPVQDPTAGGRVGSPLFEQQLDKYVGGLDGGAATKT